MTGPTEAAAPPETSEGTAAVAELVAAGLDDWLVIRIDAAGDEGMSLAEIQMAVWRQYGRWIGPIFLEEACNRLARDEGPRAARIACGPGWLSFRSLARQDPAATAAVDDEGQE